MCGIGQREWHALLDRLHVAEGISNALAEAILREHDDNHPESAQWCLPACRAAQRAIRSTHC